MFLSCGQLKVKSFRLEHIFVFLQLEVAYQAEWYIEIYALDIVMVLLLISMVHVHIFIDILNLLTIKNVITSVKEGE